MIYDEPTETLKIIDFGSALVFEGRNATERRCTGTVFFLQNLGFIPCSLGYQEIL
jgi:hypothetical protein